MWSNPERVYLEGTCCEPDGGSCCCQGSWCCKRAGSHTHDKPTWWAGK